MTKVQIFYDGDPISPSGIGKSQALTATVTQTLSVTVAVPSARFWLAGNGVSSVLATSATLSQGSKSIPITVNGATSFYIPATGRWSDYASIADFDLPGNVTISISFPEEVQAPTFGDNTDPDEPVATSTFSYSDIWTFTIAGSGCATEDDGVICLDTGDTPGVVFADAGVGDSLPISFKTKLNKVGSMINFGADGLNIFFYNNNCICKISFAEDGVYIASLHQGKPPVDYNGYDVGYTTTKVIGASISSDWQQWTIVPVTRNYTGHYIDVSSLDDWRVIVGAEKISVSGGLLLNSDTYGYAYAVTDVAYPPVVDIEIEIDLIEQHVDVNGNSTYFIIDLFGIEIQFYYNEVIIYEYFAGSSMLSYSHVASLSGKHTIKVCRDDTAIKFYVDGSLIYTTTQMYFKNNRITLGSYVIEGWYANVTRIESIRITNPDNLWDDSVKIFKGSEILGIYPSSDIGGVSPSPFIMLLLMGYYSSNNICFELIDKELTEITFNSTITLSDNPSPGDTLTLKGSAGGEDIVFTFVDFTPVALNQIQIGADTTEPATNIAAALNNIEGAEFVATADGNVITITAYSPELEIETESDEINIGIITKTTADIISEEASASDSFTAEDGGKAVQENASAADNIDGLIDGLSETASATAVIDCLMDSMDEGANAADNFYGLIDYMGDET
jgi:hypothetical protein